jgi:hypothetical protein
LTTAAGGGGGNGGENITSSVSQGQMHNNDV